MKKKRRWSKRFCRQVRQMLLPLNTAKGYSFRLLTRLNFDMKNLSFIWARCFIAHVYVTCRLRLFCKQGVVLKGKISVCLILLSPNALSWLKFSVVLIGSRTITLHLPVGCSSHWAMENSWFNSSEEGEEVRSQSDTPVIKGCQSEASNPNPYVDSGELTEDQKIVVATTLREETQSFSKDDDDKGYSGGLQLNSIQSIKTILLFQNPYILKWSNMSKTYSIANGCGSHFQPTHHQ